MKYLYSNQLQTQNWLHSQELNMVKDNNLLACNYLITERWWLKKLPYNQAVLLCRHTRSRLTFHISCMGTFQTGLRFQTEWREGEKMERAGPYRGRLSRRVRWTGLQERHSQWMPDVLERKFMEDYSMMFTQWKLKFHFHSPSKTFMQGLNVFFLISDSWYWILNRIKMIKTVNL